MKETDKVLHLRLYYSYCLKTFFFRNMVGDEDLPEWFVEDENQYNNQPVEVDPVCCTYYLRNFSVFRCYLEA